MTWPESFRSDFENRTLVLAPTGNDAYLTVDYLRSSGHTAEPVRDVASLVKEIVAGCGTVLIAEESLTPGAVTRLFEALKGQPIWSDVPVILVATAGVASEAQAHRLSVLGASANVTILERPFRSSTLIAVVEVALRARRRQFEARTLLADLRQAREVAEHANRAKDSFLAALSHELRTPLNPVLLLCSDRAADESLSPALREVFDQISRNVTLEARLIDDLLDLTRIIQGKLALDLRPVDGHQVLQEALKTAQADIRDKRIRLSLNLQARPSTVLGDGVRLQQVLWNVLKNAAKFTPEGGSMAVDTFVAGEFVVRVTDSGVGLTPQEITRVFQAFEQGDHARARSGYQFGGLGLGLAICRMLVEAHGGTIQAESPGRNRGATFTVRLPLTADRGPSASPPPPPAPGTASPAHPLSILLVEDHQVSRFALSHL
ncbi:MAG TPA: ATP-binding protein, partial [Candidatus Limnocylindria bacterium]|nr:ATP-binding protein [Candidatus Limnocylindria bacterium]